MKLVFRRLSSSLLVTVIVYCAGCSVHSTQYEFVKSLVSKKEEGGPKKNWIIEWKGLRTPVYAINGQGYVLFADEFGAQLQYQSSQVTYIKGFLPKGQGEEITVAVTPLYDGVRLGYQTQGELIKEVHSCSLWLPPAENSNKEMNISLWVQSCFHRDFQYQNRRWLNEAAQLVRAEFFLKRDYPPANIFLLKKAID